MNKKIRPVDEYYLLCCANLEYWSWKRAITLVFVYLYNQGYIHFTTNILVTPSGARAIYSDNLKAYEDLILKSLLLGDYPILYFHIQAHNWRQDLLNLKLLEKKTKKILFLHFSKIVIASDGRVKLNELKIEKELLSLVKATILAENWERLCVFPSLWSEPVLTSLSASPAIKDFFIIREWVNWVYSSNTPNALIQNEFTPTT